MATSTLARFETGSAMAVMLDKTSAGALGGTGMAFDWRSPRCRRPDAGVAGRRPFARKRGCRNTDGPSVGG